MHYHAEIHVPDADNVQEQVEKIMAPFRERRNNRSGFWDFWGVGGRWTGAHDGYDPRQDPENYETCDLCDGTGLRNDAIGQKARLEDSSYTCNGCTYWNDKKETWGYGPFGPGKSLKLAFDFKPHAGDVVAVQDIPDDLSCYTLIAGGKVFFSKDLAGGKLIITPFGKTTVKAKLQELGITTGFLVTVDYHC